MTIDDNDFERRRLDLFSTGPLARFAWREGADYMRRQSAVGKLCVRDVLARADRVLIQPRCGVSDHESMKSLHDTLAHADIGTITIDSNTRLNLWDKARPEGRLNGYPLVTHGVARGRELADRLAIPIEVRHGSPDGRHLAEVAFACGLSSFEGGGISYNLPYCKDVPLRRSLANYRYIDRLAAKVSEAACVPIDRETFGTLTAVLMPPSIALAVCILEVELAAEQGVRCVTLALPETGCLLQDVAALQVAPGLCRAHLARLGLPRSIEIFTSFHQWMGVFPSDPDLARRVIAYGVIAAAMGGATKLINKTPEEALGLPSPEANAGSIRSCQALARFCAGIRLPTTLEGDLAEERDATVREVNELLDAVYDLGTGDLVESIALAFERGLLDIPFPASRHARGEILPSRDASGAIRFLMAGRLPFGAVTRSFHRDRLRSIRVNHRDLSEDITYMARGGNMDADHYRASILHEFDSAIA